MRRKARLLRAADLSDAGGALFDGLLGTRAGRERQLQHDRRAAPGAGLDLHRSSKLQHALADAEEAKASAGRSAFVEVETSSLILNQHAQSILDAPDRRVKLP